MKIQTTLLAVALLTAGSTTAQEETVTVVDKFDLWNECGRMTLVVEELDDDATAIGLVREDIVVAVRSRLRSARIYTAERYGPSLYVNVNVTPRAFNVSIKYRKIVYDPVSEITLIATTWDTGGAGTHGDDAGFILSAVSQHTDRFIDEYLRVNEEACSQSQN